jgi:hypothetical protein
MRLANQTHPIPRPLRHDGHPLGSHFWRTPLHWRNLCRFPNEGFFAISIVGLLIGLISILFRGRTIRRNWKKVTANVIDQEYKRVLGPPGLRGGAGKNWAFRLLCEFDLGGKRYTVTPCCWSTFVSESSVNAFLENIVSPAEKCQIWVNPKNPLQAELIANDIKGLLLH